MTELIQPTAAQRDQLVAFFKDWQGALDRLATAHAAVRRWKAEAKLKEARFKGAAEFVFGSKQVAFTYDEGSDSLTFNLNERRRKEPATGTVVTR